MTCYFWLDITKKPAQNWKQTFVKYITAPCCLVWFVWWLYCKQHSVFVSASYRHNCKKVNYIKGSQLVNADKIVQKEILPTKTQARHLSHSHIALFKPIPVTKSRILKYFLCISTGSPRSQVCGKTLLISFLPFSPHNVSLPALVTSA